MKPVGIIWRWIIIKYVVLFSLCRASKTHYDECVCLCTSKIYFWRNFWTLGIHYADWPSSKLKENHSEIICVSQRGNIFSNLCYSLHKMLKISIEKKSQKHHSIKSIGELSSHLRSMFQNVAFCLGEIFPSPYFNVSSLLHFFSFYFI